MSPGLEDPLRMQDRLRAAQAILNEQLRTAAVEDELKDARAMVWADVSAHLNDRADMYEAEGDRPCEVRELRMLANAYRTYAEGVGIPSMDTLRRNRRKENAALTRVKELADRWADYGPATLIGAKSVAQDLRDALTERPGDQERPVP